jgi:hypothetical protein
MPQAFVITGNVEFQIALTSELKNTIAPSV